MKSHLIKLKALQTRISKYRNESFKRACTQRYLDEYVLNPLNQLIDEIKDINQELFGNFKLQNYKSELEEAIYDPNVFKIISNDIQYFVDIIEENSKSEITDISITDKGIFFAGQYFDALVKIAGIVEQAVKEIVLIDGYIDEKIINVLKQKNPAVKLKILTTPKTFTKISPFIETYRKQYGELEIKESNAFHDRFLIIDSNIVYHFGASLKDAGNKGFMFSIIEEEILKKGLIYEFQKEWK